MSVDMKQGDLSADMRMDLPARQVFIENMVIAAIKGAVLRLNDFGVKGELHIHIELKKLDQIVPDAVYYNPYSEGGTVRHGETWGSLVPFTEGLSHHERIVQLTELQPYANDLAFWKKTAIALAGGLDQALKGEFE